MDIHIITFNAVPHSAYLGPLTALKRYRTLTEDTDIVGDYGIISLPVQDASQQVVEADAESRCGHANCTHLGQSINCSEGCHFRTT